MNKTIWNRKEYAVLLQSLITERTAGVLLSGELGVGKSMMVRSLLDSNDITMPVIRVICSAALTKSPYGALAPLLTGAGQEITDVIAIREALIVVRDALSEAETQAKALILVEEAQYIDSASAFVLGQLVRSGSVKLLVLSNEDHQDPFSLEALMSVARLTRIRIGPLAVGEVAEYCAARLGDRLSKGSVMIVHQTTAGFQGLVQEFIDLAVRQDAFIRIGGFLVLKQYELQCDEHAIEKMRELTHRQRPAIRPLLEMLSLCGPLTLTQLRTLELLDVLPHQQTALINVRGGTAWLASSFLADGIRQGIPPGRSVTRFEETRTLLGEQLPLTPQLARWAMYLGRPLSQQMLRESIPHAIRTHEYSLVLELLDRYVESFDAQMLVYRVQALLGAGLLNTAGTLPLTESRQGSAECPELAQNLACVVRWYQPAQPLTKDGTLDQELLETAPRQDTSASAEPGGEWEDCWLIAGIQRARLAYRIGNLDRAVDLGRVPVSESSLLAPACKYRLSLLVVTVRSLIARGCYDSALEAVEDFILADGFEVLHCHGTLQLLRALVLVHQGSMSSAREYLSDASAELSVSDPEGLAALGDVLISDVMTQPADRGRGPEEYPSATDFFGEDSDESRPLSRAAEYWWREDQVEAKLRRELQTANPAATTLTRLLEQAGAYSLILQGALHFHLWAHTEDEELLNRSLRFFGQLSVPEDCKILTIQRQTVLIVSKEDIHDMQQFALQLYEEGEKVAALEMFTRIVAYWSKHNNPRNRGFAIRKIHEWLHELGQEPWGIIAKTLETSGLTARENEIVDLVRQGMSNREIARVLTVSQRTVEGHLYRIFAKLGITQRSELNFGE